MYYAMKVQSFFDESDVCHLSESRQSQKSKNNFAQVAQVFLYYYIVQWVDVKKIKIGKHSWNLDNVYLKSVMNPVISREPQRIFFADLSE